MKSSIKVLLIILFVLIVDQSLKIWVKTHMEYNDSFNILGLDWALIYFVENPGMAFGIELGGSYGKLALSLFRIFAVAFLIYYLRQLIRANIGFGLLASFSLILAGAIGNIIDSAFYGLIFSESPFHGGVATLFPEGGGYAGFLHGRVVDMLYFPLFEGNFPSWFPIWGGEHFLFFKPIFNIADLSITVGVLYILLFQRSFFTSSSKAETPPPSGAAVSPETTPESGVAEDDEAPLASSTPEDDADEEDAIGLPSSEKKEGDQMT